MAKGPSSAGTSPEACGEGTQDCECESESKDDSAAAVEQINEFEVNQPSWVSS